MKAIDRYFPLVMSLFTDFTKRETVVKFVLRNLRFSFCKRFTGCYSEIQLMISIATALIFGKLQLTASFVSL